MIITVSGIDCAGKSTQLERLRDRLIAHGTSPRMMWFRPGYSRELDGLRAVVRRLRPGLLPRADEGAAESASREAVFERPGVRKGWVAMALVDTWIQYVLKLRAYHLMGETILCDRYLFDARLDLELRFPELSERAERAFGILESLAPRPDHAFMLMLSFEEMTARMEAKDEPFPDPEDVRRTRFERYLIAGARAGFTVIDADRDREAIADDIWERVCASLR